MFLATYITTLIRSSRITLECSEINEAASCDVVIICVVNVVLFCFGKCLFALITVLDFFFSMYQMAINQAIMEGEEEDADADADAGMSLLEEKPSRPRTRNRPKREAETSSM